MAFVPAEHFSRFYHLRENVFKRNPSVNSPNLKVYWIGKFEFHNPTFLLTIAF